MRLVCVIASQGYGSNHRSYKDHLRPVYLSATIVSLLENTRPPDAIYVSYNDKTKEGMERYDHTVREFVDNDNVVFLRQDNPCAQFLHIEKCVKVICETLTDPDTHVLFMDDDDFLGSKVIQMWSDWYIRLATPYMDYSKIMKHSMDNFCSHNLDNVIMPNPKKVVCKGICKPYMWYTDRLEFGNCFNYIVAETHISQVEEWVASSADFPGTIVPLNIVTIILGHINWEYHPATDCLFRIAIDNLLKHMGLKVVESSVIEKSCMPETRLLYRR